ncbi:hypothetical protein H6F43_03305 [Leptolyngbya sp. FACHB-36]|uniref:hypothetical protein n=1 Tax=Leptolyngbya sp. FACHB-36 TaxID=2692808 RepID=UPI0016809C58|nr:hypothetical protein [Leptolyngbya sp. FACHB-36]MBD2019211.1 hypothetical protein [Leptolyngbya sp. FACHB-36]
MRWKLSLGSSNCEVYLPDDANTYETAQPVQWSGDQFMIDFASSELRLCRGPRYHIDLDRITTVELEFALEVSDRMKLFERIRLD